MYQKITIVGNLGGDPELRYTPSGEAVTSFSVATNRRWTGQDGVPQEETAWFRVSAWGKQAETCNQYLSKGRQVMVEGRMVPDRETGGPKIWYGSDGAARTSFEIRAIVVQFLGGSSGEGSGGGSSPAAESMPEDEIPF